jgi:RNA polymerase sigma factor (TIGR02999 family)
MSDVTRILAEIDSGDEQAAGRLLPLVYDELRRLAARKLAHEAPGQTLQATALVHEAYLRLVQPDAGAGWDGRAHFFAAAAEAMRRILIDRARDRRRLRRGGGRARVDLDLAAVPDATPDDDLLALDEALNALEAHDPAAARLVKLRVFVGLGQGEAAAALGLPRRSADRLWAFARAWLYHQLHAGQTPPPP